MSDHETASQPGVALAIRIERIMFNVEAVVYRVLDFVAHLTAEIAAFIVSIAEMLLALWIGAVILLLCVELSGK